MYAYFVRGDKGWEFIGFMTGTQTIEADRLYRGSVFRTRCFLLEA